jgi:sortase A
MRDSKYGKVLTVILAIVIIAIIVLLCFFGYDVYRKITTDRSASAVLDEFNESINKVANETVENSITEGELVTPILNEELTEQTTSTGNKKVTYKGYNVVGTIEIPAINLKYPILERATVDSIELSVAVLYGPGPNQVGNTVIVGHNYRNGSFFGNNDRLKLGDKVYITDASGTRIQYNIYNIYETTPDDGDYIERDTNGKREISLSTCTDNSKARLIIWAVEE